MKLITLFGAALAVSAVLASTALGGGGRLEMNPQGGLRDAGAQSTHPVALGATSAGAVVDATGTQPVRPDDRAGLLGVGGAQAITAASGRPDGRLVPDGADVPDSRPTLVLVNGDGFDWGDATVGALGALGSCLLAAALGIAAWRTRRTGEPHVTV